MRLDRPIWYLALAQTIIWAGLFYIFPALLVKWEADLAWSKTELTATFAAAIAMSALCSPLSGRMIDRGHGPAMLAGGAIVGGLLVGSLAFVQTYAVFFAVWLAIGATLSACLYEPCFALVTRARGADARRSITLITLVAGFAGTVSFPLAHGISVASGWRNAVIAFAVLVCCVGAPLALAGARRLEAEATGNPEYIPHSAKAASHAFLKTPVFWLLAIGFAMMALNHGIVLNHLLPLLAERGISADTAVFAASMIGPMQVTGRLAMMAAERHVTSRGTTIASFLAVMTAVVCLWGAGAVPMLLVGFVVLHGAGYGVTSIMRPVVTRDIMGQRGFGAISGAMATPSLAASAAAPFLGSLLWEVGGYDFALKTAFAATFVGLVCYAAAARFRRT